jgi:methylase of polypeptide subunit release factors
VTPANSLHSEPVRNVLDRLHAEAKSQRFQFLALLPRFAGGFLRGQKFFDMLTPEAMKDFYIPVSREQGEFLYLTARALRAKRVVEFGTSFGVSTIYLAAAVRDNGGGEVIGSEILESKARVAEVNLKAAGLEEALMHESERRSGSLLPRPVLVADLAGYWPAEGNHPV